MIDWQFNDLNQFADTGVEILGNPIIAEISDRKGLQFNGSSDAIILPKNPIGDLSVFTIELVFYPEKSGLEEQRIFHLGSTSSDRVLVETRLPGNDEWFLDTFIASGESNCTLFNRDKRHQLEQWYNLALVFDGYQMSNYVNMVEENRGKLDFVPQANGETSIGVRLNRICWFKGLFSRIRITDSALQPKEFLEW